MTDNEWAAEFCAPPIKLVSGRGHGEVIPVIPPPFHDWQPDKDLNQFKLVLDKFRFWIQEQGLALPDGSSLYNGIVNPAWNDPASSLKRIREAVEK